MSSQTVALGVSLAANLVAVLAFFKPLAKLPGRIRARVMPDHTGLRGAAYQHDSGGRGPCPYVNVSLGPSRRFRGRAARQLLDPKVVHKWMTEVFGAVPEPEYRDPHQLVRYQYGPMQGDSWLWIHRRGLVDISVPVPVTMTDGAVFLPLENLVGQILAVAKSVQSGWYERVYPRPLFGRRRLDWSISIGASVLDDRAMRVQLAGFTFPGRAPGPKPTGMPLNGTPSAETLRALSTRSAGVDPRDIVRVALVGLLTGCGYTDCGAAIEDALAVAGKPVGQRVPSPAPEF